MQRSVKSVFMVTCMFLAAVLLVGVQPGAALAADPYPDRPVKIVVAYPPGGQNDVAARIVGKSLSTQLKQPVVVENKPGAGGIIAAQFVASSEPDGYTLFLVAINHAILTTLKPNTQYKLEKDFAPVGMVAAFPIILVVNPSLPVKSVKDLIAYAKANPGKLTFGSSGPGGGVHLAGELFCSMAGVKMRHVPYKGSAPAMIDLLGGHIDMMFADSTSALQHMKEGKLRALGISSQQRSPLVPDLPTIAEAGVPGYESNSWVGILVPAGTPAAIVTRLNADLNKSLNDPEVKAQLFGIGGEPRPGTPEQFGKFIHAEIAKWEKIIKEVNLPIME